MTRTCSTNRLSVSAERGSAPFPAYTLHVISSGADFMCTLKEKYIYPPPTADSQREQFGS